jgi:predicted Zn finger-like uncharacterized protein
MPIEFNCPNCFKSYRVADSNVGKKVKCKDCGAAMTVPDMSGLSLADEDTGLHRRPARRHSSTKILPAERPKKSGATSTAPKRNVPSDTVKLSSGARIMRPPVLDEPEAPKPASKLPPGKLPSSLRSPTELPKLKSAAGRTRVMPQAPSRRWPNIMLMIGAAAVIVGFFLPWFDPGIEGFDPIAGFMLPLKANDLVSAIHEGGLLGDNPVVDAMDGDKTAMFAWFAVYLLPVLALYAVIDDIRNAGKGKSHWWIRILAVLGPVIAAAAVYFAFRPAFDALTTDGLSALQPEIAAIGPGAYTSAVGWLLLLMSVPLAPRVPKPKKAADSANPG